MQFPYPHLPWRLCAASLARNMLLRATNFPRARHLTSHTEGAILSQVERASRLVALLDLSQLGVGPTA